MDTTIRPVTDAVPERVGLTIAATDALAAGEAVIDAWDRLVQSTPGTDVTQLSAWARLRSAQGYRSVVLTVHDGPDLVGGAQVLVRRVPLLGRIGYVPYGPVLGPDAADRAAVVDVLGDIVARLRRVVRMLFVQPPEGAEDVTDALLRRGFRPSAAEIAPIGSVRVDLTQDEEQIRARFSRRLRSWPNRWPSRGVTVRHGDENDLPLLNDLMRRTAATHGFPPPDLAYLSLLYRELAPTGNAALFVGEVDGNPVCADIVTICGGMVRGRHGGFDRSGPGGRLAVPAAVRWEIIRWAKQRGHHWLDFGGVADVVLRDAIDRGLHDSPDWPSVDRAKLSFGAAAYRYPQAVEAIQPLPVRLGYDTANRTALGRGLVERAKLALRGRPARRGAPGRPGRDVRQPCGGST